MRKVKNGFFTNPTLLRIGSCYDKSPAQVALRFRIQSGVVVIPKSIHKERMKVLDFTLTREEIAEIEALDTENSLFFSHQDPKTVEWFMSLV